MSIDFSPSVSRASLVASQLMAEAYANAKEMFPGLIAYRPPVIGIEPAESWQKPALSHLVAGYAITAGLVMVMEQLERIAESGEGLGIDVSELLDSVEGLAQVLGEAPLADMQAGPA